MTLPKQTATALIAAGFRLFYDFQCGEDNDGVHLKWKSSQTKPSEQQITAWATDADTLPNGQLFSEWQAENGGDEIKTNKRLLRQAFVDAVDNGDIDKLAIRAVIDVFATITNTPRTQARQAVLSRMEQILDRG